jgi:hypothetical protein
VFAAIVLNAPVEPLAALLLLGSSDVEVKILYEPPYQLELRQLALMLTVEVGMSVWASRALVVVVEWFAQASRVSAAEPISEVECDLAYEVE